MASTKSVRNKLPKKVALVVMVIVIVAAIALAAFYFAAPDKFRATFPFFFDDGTPSGNGTPPLARGDGELQVHFIDVGQGDCILILFPDGKDMLIDCGTTKGGDLDETLAYISTYVPDKQLDYLMLTHSDDDHVGYINEIIYEYDVDNIFMPDILAMPSGRVASAELQAQIEKLDKSKLAMFDDEDGIDTNAYAEFFIAALSEPDCNIYINVDSDENTNSVVITDNGLQEPTNPDTDATYRLTFYCPTQEYYDSSDLSSAEEKNAISPIGILEYNDFRLVLTGDSNEINEPIIAERIGKIDCDVLKVAHHGSESSSLDVFLNAVDCEYAVISCGEGNSHHHPRQVALDRLIAQDMTIYRTDNNGNIVLTVTDGDNFTFNTEKEASQEQNRDGWTDEEIKAEKEKD